VTLTATHTLLLTALLAVQVMKGESVPQYGVWAGVPACATAKAVLQPSTK